MADWPLISHRDPGATIAFRAGRPVSAARFLTEVRALARHIPENGHVLNLCADRYRFAVGLGAALLRGAISVLPGDLAARTLKEAARSLPDAVCLADVRPACEGLRLLTFPEAPEPDAPFEVPLLDGKRIAARLFTSGTTGSPKPQDKTWESLVIGARTKARSLGLGAGTAAVLGTTPSQHMYGLETSVMLPLQNGLALVAERPFYPGDICSSLAELPRPRVLAATPYHLNALLRGSEELPETDLVVSATAPLSLELAREVEGRMGASLLEIFGSTETGQVATRRTARETEWQLAPGIRLEWQDDQPIASGPSIGGTAPLADRIETTAPGRFVLLGRNADMVNIAGKRSSLAYLNHQLLAVEGVRDGTFLVPYETPADGIARLAALAVAPGHSATSLRKALGQRIDPVFLPRPLVLVDALPRNESGKLPQAALLDLLRETLKANGA